MANRVFVKDVTHLGGDVLPVAPSVIVPGYDYLLFCEGDIDVALAAGATLATVNAGTITVSPGSKAYDDDLNIRVYDVIAGWHTPA